MPITVLSDTLIYDLYVKQKLSCKEVSEKLNININTLKSYIRRHKLSQEYEKECINCGKKFFTNRSNSKFCSDECYKEYNNKNNDKYKYPESGIRVCQECGKEYFYDKTKHSYYKDNKKPINASKFCCYECGVKNALKKVQETNIKKYGSTCTLNNEEVHKKAVNTWRFKYGYNHFAKSQEIKDKIRSTINNKCEQGYVFKKTNKTYESKLEKEIKEYIQSLGFSPIKYIIGKCNTRFEKDLYIPELKIGIECNGCWWHCINGKKDLNKKYHYNKYLLAKEKGIDLIQIWEDQWKLKKEIIKDILSARLNVINKTNQIYARKCKIKEVNNDDYKKFCLSNHIQGYRAAKIRLGLYYNNILVQIASFNKCQDYGKRQSQAEYEWIRGCFASNNFVVGGTSRLLKYFINTYNPESILCYADANLFDGRSYKKANFDFKGYTGPDKFYIENNTFKRYGRNPYKYKEFKESVKNGKYFECYGAGSLKFIWYK